MSSMIIPKLSLPDGTSEEGLLSFLASLPIGLPPWPQEVLSEYYRWHFKRFLYTYGLMEGLKGRCLELGAAPYFMTIILRQFTDLDLVLANYFGPDHQEERLNISYKDFHTGKEKSIDLSYHYFNIEDLKFPFKDGEFDVILFCEIIEHLFVDPFAVLKEVKRVLKPGGALILTTPNANRMENAAKMIAGINIYDPYSGYWGSYGRHNREYNITEILQLLDHCGFTTEEAFTADITENKSGEYVKLAQLEPLLSGREYDLGQYIFVRARNTGVCQKGRPSFLFMNYPSDELVDVKAEFLKEKDILSVSPAFTLREWHGCEDWNGRPTRWMGEEALLLLCFESSHILEMSLQAMSFHRPRNMEIYLEGVLLLKVLVSTCPSRICVEVPIKKGMNNIMFKAVEKCERPCDIEELKSKDGRCLSFAIQEITFA